MAKMSKDVSGERSKIKKQHRSIGSVKKGVREGKLVKPKKIGRNSDIAASPPDGPKKSKKAHKWKAGTLAAMEVKRYQTGKKATCPLITKQAIENLIRDTLAEFGDDYRIQKDTILSMRAAVEDEAIRLFESSRVLALHAKRKTIDVKDMRAVAKVRQIYPGSSDTGRTSFVHVASHKKSKKSKKTMTTQEAVASIDGDDVSTNTVAEHTDEPITSDDQ